MRPLGTSAAIAIGGVLALLLIAYVFLGGSRGDAHNAPHCTSPQALDLVKRELFRRAAATRNSNDAVFANAQNYSVLHAQSRLVRRLEGGSGKVSCSGALVLDLPPGVAAAGGRRSLAAQLQYRLEPAGAGSARLLMLNKADDLVVPLATVSGAANEGTPPLAQSMPVANEALAETTVPTRAPPAPRPMPQVIQRPPAPPRATPPPPRAAPPQPAKPPQKPQPRKEASAGAHAKPAPPPSVTPAPSPPPAPAVVRPSFNCRYARTRGEVAVCGNPGLAVLDRQMSGQFYSALAAARPGQRAMLQRSRDRFLAYRDSCSSDACVADAYRARMREIAAIMEGRW